MLDLRDEADAALARELARRADVVIENFKPGGLVRFGLDYETVRAGNPSRGLRVDQRIRHGRRRATLPGYDLMVQAVSGPDEPDRRPGRSAATGRGSRCSTSWPATTPSIGILAALRHRDATGQGQHVEINLLSSALAGLVNHSSAYVAGGVVPYRMGNAHPSVFPYEPLPTADRDLIVATANDGQFRRLCAVLGIPEIPDDPRFAHNADRTANRAALRPILVERLATRGATEWFEELVAVGVPCGPINTIDGGFAMAERFGLDPVVQVGQGDRAVPSTRNPIRFSASPVRYDLPPPRLDEHGAELRKWLSTSREDDRG